MVLFLDQQQLPPAKFWRRFIAFAGDLTLSWALVYWFYRWNSFRSIHDTITSAFADIWQQFGPLETVAPTLVMIYLLTMVLRVLMNIIFGQSLFQGVLGLQGKSSFFWSRVGGFIRALVEIFTTPFIIFDLPCVIGKKTLQETLSATELVQTRKPPVLGFFVVIILSGLALYSPLFYNRDLVHGVPVFLSETAPAKISNDSDFTKFVNYQSHYFEFETFTSLDQGRFELIPSFQLIHKGSKPAIERLLHVYDRDYDQDALIKKMPSLDWGEWLYRARIDDPIFAHKFPLLHKFLSRSENLHLTDDEFSELEEFIRGAMSLSVGNLIEHTVKFGPFIRGRIDFRTSVFAQLNTSANRRVDIATLGNEHFFELSEKHKSFGGNKGKIIQLVNLSYLDAPRLLLSFDNNEQAKDFQTNFIREFFGAAKWYFYQEKEKTFFVDEEKMSEFSPLVILDYWPEKLKRSQRKLCEEYLEKYYKKLVRESIKQDKPKLRKLIELSIERLVATSKLDWSYRLTKKFHERMNNFLLALSNNNYAFAVKKVSE